MKHRLGVLDKYRIFVITQRAKRMKNAADGTMDLQSYVEFKRNYRMLARVHKEALQHLRDFWKLFMRSKTQDATVKQALKSLTESSTHAQMVYTKFMERYPNNGKVLKCYGKFLEEVKNDIAGAAKYYSEGNRLGSTDAIMNMDFDLASKKKNDFLVSMDMHEDAVIIIDAVGTILMISQGLTAMFGYTKIELENANVNMLMPQPFSQRHPSYLQRYTSTGDPHIIDKVQEVVALHKDKFVFPTELGVTQLSGTGSDCVFLGVMKKMPMSIDNVRVWVAPNGVVLCADQQFSGLMGYPSEALVGMSIYTLLENPAAGEAFTEQCKSAILEDFAEHRIKTTARFVGKYLPPVPCSITVKLGGTQTERIFVWNVKRTDRNDEMTMVCDTHGTITFATWDVAALLGTNTRKLVGTKLDTLLPPPYNSMHAKWLQETPPIIPPSSCRAGVVVNLLNSSHVLVPVRIKVHQIEDQGRTLHVVRLTRAAPEALVEEKRVSLTCNLRGTIEEIEPSVSQLFGWPALEMKGRHIADVVDTFATWRQRIADRYHGGDLELCMADASSGGTKLLLLALMDQEYARPGGSYRVSVKPPDTDFATAIAAAQITQHQGATLHELLHNAANAAKIRAARPAVMQPEVVEVDGVPAVKVHLFKQESLTGYLEMDPSLNIRKADMWAALVLGWPTAMLTSQKLHNLLQVPPNCGWEELMGIKAQMGGLKRVNRGTVTAPRKFVASHPDGGTMRITIQGVSKSEGLGSKNRIEATLHADTAFKGEPSTIFEILELEDSQGNANALSISESREEGNARRAGEAERNSRGTSLMDKAGGDSGGGGGGRRVSSSSGTGNAFTNRMKLEKSGSGRALLGVDEGDEGEEEELHKRESGGSSNEGGSLDEEAAMNGSMGSGEDEEGGREDGGDGLPGQPVPRISAMGAMMQGSDDEDEEGEEEAKKSENKPSDFVAQWVRTVANQGERPETPNSNAGDSEVGDDKHTTSRARPALMAIDEDNEDMVGGEEEFQQSRHLTEMRGSPLGSKRRTSGTGGGFGTRAEEGEEHPDARASVDLPPPGEDWEREVADMPDEAAEIALAKKAKGGKRPGNKLQAAGGDQPSQPGDDGHSESSAGDGGTETDGQSVNSSNSAHDEILIDFRRGRLLKKLIKLVRGPSLMEPLERLDVGTLRVLAAVLAVHIVCFAVIMVLFAEKAENMTVIKRHALTIQSFERMRFRAVQAKFCTSDVVGVGLSFPDDNMCELARDPSKMQTTLLDAVDGFSMDHHDTYLGLDGNVAKLKSPQARALWDDTAVDAMVGGTPKT
ncbi:hypothetical protein DUNSADRAFT_13938 [Dunaliella salina]|uniref:PAS domain-containing protein n=1 Tax=Dunaliella salina TaxID=3046 RepID=A0ABQ7G8C5_DUNSA|nr:hypothetical protein DUNSADRAFT_13938 [Dunaliella salina]|eukprot:KAF5830858.1 hypothetical protein DUNSADRAFT_13938 [Dunaliella salina]